MCFGILLSLFNALHFKKYYNVYWEFIPQMLFMLSIFGYMCLLIIIKWCTDYQVPLSSEQPKYLTLLFSAQWKGCALPPQRADRYVLASSQLAWTKSSLSWAGVFSGIELIIRWCLYKLAGLSDFLPHRSHHNRSLYVIRQTPLAAQRPPETIGVQCYVISTFVDGRRSYISSFYLPVF